MALQRCGLNLDKNKLELQPHGTLDFPCAGYYSQHADSPDDTIPWHRHEELEIIYLLSGQLELKVPGKTFCLEQGEVFLINSNILHFAAAERHCEIQSLVFHPSLITGQDNSVFAQKYITPLINCEALDGCRISHTTNCGKQIAADFVHAFDAISLNHQVMNLQSEKIYPIYALHCISSMKRKLIKGMLNKIKTVYV